MSRIATLLACLAGLSVSVSGASGAQGTSVEAIKILNYGKYSATSKSVEKLDGTATGTINIVDNYKLREQTEVITARVGERFGVEYMLTGRPTGEAVQVTFITRFPLQGVVNPKGERFTKNEFERTVTIGELTYRTYRFDDAWELALGEWSMEFYYQGRLLASKRFTVVAP